MKKTTRELTGWLLDLYPRPGQGLILWLLGDDGQRHRLRQPFPVSFYVAGRDERLRSLWRHLQALPGGIALSRTQRRDLFAGMTTVLEARVAQPASQPGIFQDAYRRFPDLTFYDADLHASLRHAAVHGTFPLARCRMAVDASNTVLDIQVLDSPWDLDPQPAPLRMMTLEPDVMPFHAAPRAILVHAGKKHWKLDLASPKIALKLLAHLIRQVDPDLLLTNFGDTWLLPHLLELSGRENVPLPLNREPDGDILTKPERVYHAYGQIIYRGQQAHLYGRWHVDTRNAVMYGDYELHGVLEMARVTALPVQTVARVSPGTGISSMQVVTALRQGVLVPFRKQQAERPKTAVELWQADMGGLVYQPRVGLHQDVAEVDFISMYPSIMERFNISPETVGTTRQINEQALRLESFTGDGGPGLVPQTLKPLLEKRIRLKNILLDLSRWDCFYKRYQACSAAHKWLLVTCFGYLGYKNARFGRIEAHEAVTAFGREVLLRAKEIAEDMGFRVLHLYVDGMWVKKTGFTTVRDYQPLLEAILEHTGLPIAMDGIYRYVAFLPSRVDARIPVPNRYFGIFHGGEVKARGIELRRHDTPPFIADLQREILELFAADQAGRPARACTPAINRLLNARLSDLRVGRIPLERLLVTQTVSRAPDEYRASSPASVALRQLAEVGKSLRPGQRIRFLYTLGKPGVRAWDLPESPDPRTVDVSRYRRLVMRAVSTVLEPLVGGEVAPGSNVSQPALL